MKPKILIEVSGGVVQAVYGTELADVVIVDHDNYENGGGDPDAVHGADVQFEDGQTGADFLDRAGSGSADYFILD